MAKDSLKLSPKPAPIVLARPIFDTDTLTEVYGKSDGAPHYVLIYFLDPAAFNNSFTIKIDNFDGSAYVAEKLTSRAVLLDKDNKLIHVKSFKDKVTAQAYITALRTKIETVLTGISTDQYFIGAISTLNYSTLLNSKKINNYIRFHRLNY